MTKKIIAKFKIWFINRQIKKEVKGEAEYPCFNCGNPAPPGTIYFQCGLESQFDGPEISEKFF